MALEILPSVGLFPAWTRGQLGARKRDAETAVIGCWSFQGKGPGPPCQVRLLWTSTVKQIVSRDFGRRCAISARRHRSGLRIGTLLSHIAQLLRWNGTQVTRRCASDSTRADAAQQIASLAIIASSVALIRNTVQAVWIALGFQGDEGQEEERSGLRSGTCGLLQKLADQLAAQDSISLSLKRESWWCQSLSEAFDGRHCSVIWSCRRDQERCQLVWDLVG